MAWLCAWLNLKRSGLVIAVLILVGVTDVSPVRSAPEREVIELRGRKSAFLDVRFASPLRITCCGIELSEDKKHVRQTGFTVKTEGSYAGYAIERLRDGKIMVGGVRIPPMDLDDRFPAVTNLAPGGRLAPGRYRVHLLTDGHSTVRVDVSGLDRSLRYQPTNRSPVASRLIELGPAPLAPAAHGRLDVEISPDSLVLLATQIESAASQVDYLNHCIIESGGFCQTRDDDDQRTEISPCAGCAASGLVIFDVYRARKLPAPGRYDAAFTAATAGVTTEAQGFALVLD